MVSITVVISATVVSSVWYHLYCQVVKGTPQNRHRCTLRIGPLPQRAMFFHRLFIPNRKAVAMGPRRVLCMSRTHFMLKNDTFWSPKADICISFCHDISNKVQLRILGQVSNGSAVFTSRATILASSFHEFFAQ